MNAKVALGLSDLTPEQKVLFTEERITSLNSNAATFPAPNPSVSVLTTPKNNLDTRLKAIAQQESLLDAERAYAATVEADLDALLQQEANYVENIAKGEAAIILLSGFPLAQEPTPIGQLSPPQNLLGIATDIEGETKLKWNSVHGAKSYVVECATSPDGPWSQVTVTTRISCLATNLTPGTKYWFRVRAVGAAGLSGWSDPAAGAIQRRSWRRNLLDLIHHSPSCPDGRGFCFSGNDQEPPRRERWSWHGVIPKLRGVLFAFTPAPGNLPTN